MAPKYKKPWSLKEDCFLRENYLTLGGTKIAEILARNKDDVDRRRKKLGIKAERKGQISWTQSEIQFLSENIGKMTFAEIGKMLGKSIKAIDGARRRFGLKPIDRSERMKQLYKQSNHPMQRAEVIQNFTGDKNPSRRPEVKKKISEIRKREYELGINKCGWKGPQTEPTEAERLLMGFLVPMGFEWNRIVPSGRPNVHYALDLSNDNLKICIEIDGSSHRNKKERDKRKDDYLKSVGWLVLRFTNEQVLHETIKVVNHIQSVICDLNNAEHAKPKDRKSYL